MSCKAGGWCLEHNCRHWDAETGTCQFGEIAVLDAGPAYDLADEDQGAPDMALARESTEQRAWRW